MPDQSDFRDAGEDFLAHYGKLGMRWGHRSNSGLTSEKNSDSYDNHKPSYVEVKTSNEPSYTETHTNKAGMSRNGKIATGILLGVVGVGLVAAMSPSARNIGKEFYKARKGDLNVTQLKPQNIKVPDHVQNAASKTAGKYMKSAGKSWAKRLFDMTQTRDTLADMQSRIPKTKRPPTDVFNLIDFMPKVMSKEVALIR